MFVLDTHALIWMDQDNRKLGRTTRQLIMQAWTDQALGVSAITFWETALLRIKGRIELSSSPAEWRQKLLRAGLIEYPLDGATQFEELHKDPADCFIAATALRNGATLVTADDRLLKWKHMLVRQDARI